MFKAHGLCGAYDPFIPEEATVGKADPHLLVIACHGIDEWCMPNAHYIFDGKASSIVISVHVDGMYLRADKGGKGAG